MTILYVSTVVNHHQFYFVNELAKRFPGEVWYATIEKAEIRRKVMHFPEFHAEWIFSIPEEYQRFCDLFLNADVVLCHVRDFYKLIRKRLSNNKLIFYFSERWFKTNYGKIRLLHPHMLKLCYHFKRLSTSDKFFYLAQGEWAAKDFLSLGMFKNKIFSFGYFPNTEEHINLKGVILPKHTINIIWCGRILRWKRVDKLLKAFILLSRYYTNVHLTIVGNGPVEKRINKLIRKHSMNITKYDLLPTNVVRTIMNQADIYVLPSNGVEGWGAVINEAMAEGCAIVGNEKAGAVKTLIEDGVNGLLLHKDSVREIKACLEYLITNVDVLNQMKENAKATIQQWSPQNVCDRFLNVVQQIEKGENFDIYASGPFKLLNV